MALRVRASTVSRTMHGARRAGRVLCVPTIMEPRPLWGSRAKFAVWAKPNIGCQACHASLSHARQSPCAHGRLRGHRVVRGLRVREARGLASWDACVAPPRVLWGRLPGQGPPAALSASTHGWAGGVQHVLLAREQCVCQSAYLLEKEQLLSVAHGEASPARGGATLQRRQPGVARGHLVAVQRRAEGMPGLTYTPRQHRLRGKERCSWVVVRATLLSDAAAHGGVSWPVRAVVKRLGTLSRSVEGVPTG